MPKFIVGKFKKRDILPHQRTVIIGTTGTGKSVFLDDLVKFLGIANLVIFLDTKKEYHHLPEFKMENLKAKKGVFRVYEISYHGHTIKDSFTICEFLSALLFERKNCIFVVEELGNVVKKVGRLYDIMPNFAILLQQGRSQDVGFIGTTQRPQEIHTTILSQANHLICFNINSMQDREAVKTYFQKEWFDDLGKFQYFHLNHGQNFVKRCYKVYLSNDEKDYYRNIFGSS